MLLLFLYYTLYIITSKKIAVKEKRKHKITKKVDFLNYLILVKKIVKKKRVVKVVVLHLNQRVELDLT